MTSSESEEQARPRKRSRTSNSGEDGAAEGKKARGRPRVDTQDATAADRRRTQIRLAQRAYRQRKETTISSLKSQSTQLHSIIEQMNKTFFRLNESVLNSGLLQLNPGLAQEFKLVTETFSSLAKTASEGQYDGDEEHDEGAENPTDDRRTAKQQLQIPSQPKAEPAHVGWSYSVMNQTEKVDSLQATNTPPDNYFSHLSGTYGRPGSTTSLVRHRQFTVGEVLDQSRALQDSSQYQPTQPQQPQQPPQLPFGLVDLRSQQNTPFTAPNTHIFPVNIPTPEVTPPTTRLPTPPLQIPNPLSIKALSPITTYSFDETTFARRLTRAAVETGFQLLSTANARPAALSYVFKLSLPYFTKEQLRARFKVMLSKTINEELDWWEAPFIHLGGAGTHYPRRDALGHIIPIKNSWTARQIGPLEKRMTRLENVEDGRWEDLDGVDLSGFEGEWFDAHDVQGYLEEQYACKLDPKSSFSECLIDEEEVNEVAEPSSLLPQSDSNTRRASDEDSNSPSLTHSSTSGSTSSSASITPPTNAFDLPEPPFGLDMNFNHAPTPNYPADFPKLTNYDISFDQTLGLDLAPGFDYGFAGTAGSWSGDMNLGADLMGEEVEIVRQKRKKSAWVDTSALINEMIKHGVCLGRAPGFRRKDVDMALQKALIPAH
ncbi:Nn.00g072560.m01.CDS01 [Neocucurbitaria sp. VM-36]